MPMGFAFRIFAFLFHEAKVNLSHYDFCVAEARDSTAHRAFFMALFMAFVIFCFAHIVCQNQIKIIANFAERQLSRK